MPTPMKTGAAPARAMTPLSMLVKLAKRDSRAELVIKPDGARELQMVMSGVPAGSSSPSCHMPCLPPLAIKAGSPISMASDYVGV